MDCGWLNRSVTTTHNKTAVPLPSKSFASGALDVVVRLLNQYIATTTDNPSIERNDFVCGCFQTACGCAGIECAQQHENKRIYSNGWEGGARVE